MRKGAFAIVSVALVLAMGAPAQAHTETRTYAAGSGFRIGGTATIPVGAGGVNFSAGHAPVSVRVSDAAGVGKIAYTVCQDTDQDLICGEAGEPNVDKCVANNTTVSLGAGWSAAAATTIFIYATDVFFPCDGAVATAGTVTFVTSP